MRRDRGAVVAAQGVVPAIEEGVSAVALGWRSKALVIALVGLSVVGMFVAMTTAAIAACDQGPNAYGTFAFARNRHSFKIIYLDALTVCHPAAFSRLIHDRSSSTCALHLLKRGNAKPP